MILTLMRLVILILMLVLMRIPNRGLLEPGDMKMECEAEQLSEAFEMPLEFTNAIESLDAPQLKRTVELMGQCVQVRGVMGLILLIVSWISE